VQLVPNRSSPQPSEPDVSFRAGDLLLLRVVLDAIEPEDQIDRFLCDRRRRQGLVKVAPQVRVTRGALALRYIRDDVVSIVLGGGVIGGGTGELAHALHAAITMARSRRISACTGCR
jgi:hypothetical protein